MENNELLDFLKKKGYKRTDIIKSESGYLYIYMTLNDVKGKFCLDTGCEAIIVLEKQIDKFKIIQEKSFKKTVVTHDGNFEFPISFFNNHIKIQDYELKNCRILIADLNLDIDEVDGFIGLDVLIPGKTIIDFASMSLFTQ